MPTRPGNLDGYEGGNIATGSYGTPMIKTGGFIVWNGGGAYGYFPGATGYMTAGSNDGSMHGADWQDAPTDGGYSRIYSNHAAHVAVKDNGELECFGSYAYGGSVLRGCPKASCTTKTCTAAGVAAYYPKKISYIYADFYAFCARECYALAKTLPSWLPLGVALLAAPYCTH